MLWALPAPRTLRLDCAQAVQRQQQQSTEEHASAAPAGVDLGQNAIVHHTAQLKTYLAHLQRPFLQFTGVPPHPAASE